jgi:hypothetical protein
MELERIYLRFPDGGPGEHAAIDELFDRAVRAERLHRRYGARRRMRRFR